MLSRFVSRLDGFGGSIHSHFPPRWENLQRGRNVRAASRTTNRVLLRFLMDLGC